MVFGAVLVPAPAADAAARPCSAGLVALTFDDGPAPGVTPRLVRLLTERQVPATFFLVGSKVRSSPGEARLVARSGFVVANHTWSHTKLTLLGRAAIRDELTSTRAELRRHGLRPSALMRPPYGATSARVNRIARRLGLVPVLWTIDTRDWKGGTSNQIAARVLNRLRPHQINIVLQHDGVRRSPVSVEAVPRIVREARARGYCFTDLDGSGRPAIPVPTLQVGVTGGSEAGRVPARLTLSLDRPTSRQVSVRVTTASGTATSGADFSPVARTVVFPVGSTRMTVEIPIVDDAIYEEVEHFTVRFDRASGLRLTGTSVVVPITSEDAPPPPPPPAI